MFSRAAIIVLAMALPGVAQPASSSLTHLRNGEEFLRQGNFQSAANEFNQSLLGDGEPQWTRVWSLVNLGVAFDATGQRERAVKEYQLALATKDNTLGALAFAYMYLWKAPSLDRPAPPRDRQDIVTPKVLERVEPQYPAEALLGRLEGNILIGVEVAPDGTTGDMSVLSPLGLGLEDAALAAVRQWKFAPGTISGQPAAMVAKVTVEFHLPSSEPGWRVKKIQCRPALLKAEAFAAVKMSPELEEEATVDAAMSRRPDAALSMEIDPQGVPQNIQATAASLPMWGENAIQTVSQWRFTASQTVATCQLDLAFVN